MRLRIVAGVFVIACGGDGASKSPRDACLEAEATINTAAQSCNPATGRIDLSCGNYGTGSSCDVIDAYFDCLVQTSCNNGTLVLPTNCQLGACN